jgi:hypothetical protein
VFIAYEVLKEAIWKLPPVLEAIKRHDSHLHDQLKRAAKNAVLNCAEGGRRKGLDRSNRYRYSAGEAVLRLGRSAASLRKLGSARASRETARGWG